MKRTVLVLLIAIHGGTVNVGAQSGTVVAGIVLEAASLTNFIGRIELRGKVTITSEDFVLRADAADFFYGATDRRIEARGGISITVHPKRAALLDSRRVQLAEIERSLGPKNPEVQRLLGDIAQLEALERRIAACMPGAFGLKVELPPGQRLESRASFLSQVNGAPAPLREFHCSQL